MRKSAAQHRASVEVGDLTPQDAVLRIDQSSLNTPMYQAPAQEKIAYVKKPV